MQPEKMYPTEKEIAHYQKIGIIEPSKLVKGITLLIETVARIFEFHLHGDGRAISKANGHAPFMTDTPCTIVGCVDDHGKLYDDKIVHGKHLILALPRGRHVTGRVLSASVRGDGWSYSLWENENN